QRRIDQTSDNECFSRNDRRSQLRQVKSKLTQGLFNEFDNSADGRMNPISNGYNVRRNNTGVRNSENRRTRNMRL
uniref:FMRFamide neuropeptide n=1 Tax=Strongyloides papillosus TaxID=174720 RepID=A0A0N5BU78_STREA